MRPVVAVALRSIALVAVLAFGVIALLVSRSTAPSLPDASSLGFLLPPASTRVSMASARLAAGKQQLNDRDSPTGDRLAGYRQAVLEADELLVAALRRTPVDASVVALLAAVRYELDPSKAGASSSDVIGLIDLAHLMAPRDPRVQFDLGELLSRMGRPLDALPYFRRALALDDSRAEDTIRVLRDHGLDSQSMLGGLPDSDSVIAALESVVAAEGRSDEFIELVRDRLRAHPSTTLLAALDRAQARIADPERRYTCLNELGPFDDHVLESTRLVYLSRAMVGVARFDDAVDTAMLAIELAPGTPERHENLAFVYFDAGRFDEGIGSLQDAMHAAASHRHARAFEVRYFRMIGDAERRRGRNDLAHDAYESALHRNPDDRASRIGMRAVLREAGFDESDAPSGIRRKP